VAATITSLGVGEALFARRDVLAPEVFAVKEGGYDLNVVAAASGTLGQILRHRQIGAGDAIRKAGLIELERRISAEELEQPDEGYVEIL
jgi:hypothetical protein